ncbi:fasciclin-like arabinogalactan protein 14 [Humulus lupulus]|uniref:fasciclin-like arabinogalactan protein 14 n=1 Tax=Humulus lupulus TaxID=3486 RepID=UPI002B406D4A|nr:fasciclin-like arabinogalactan protein 14 [Humulus lupulus]
MINKMSNRKASSSILFFFVVVFLFSSSISSSSAFNITRLLGERQEFSTFNNYLTQTKLNDEINRRQTITVLAVDNAATAPLSGKPLEVIKKIFSVHVILDYFDVEKITKLGISNKTSTLTTLFQASGSAVDQEGFLKVALVNEGEIAFGSAAKGGSLNTKLVKSVSAQPFNISVFQITSLVQVPGIESTPVPVPAPKKAPAPSKNTVASSPSKDVANTPATEPTADGPVSDSPTETTPAADGPVADNAPVSSAADSPVLYLQPGMKIGGVTAAALMSCLVV